MLLPEGLEDIEVAVPSKEFKAILSKLDDVELDVKHKEDGNSQELLLRGKRRRAGIRVESILLPIDDVKIPEGWMDIPKGFTEAVETVFQCAGKDERIIVLTYLHIGPKGIEALDNAQAIRYFLKTGIEESVLVKGDDLKRIVGLKMKEWSIAASWVHFRNSDGLNVSCRRCQDNFPSLGDLFKVKGVSSPLPKSLVDATSAAEVFLDANSDLTGMSVDLRKGELRLKAQGMVGWYEEKQKIEHEGDPLQFRIAPKMLREVCSRSDHCVIGREKLLVKADKFVYVSCLVEGEDE
jgi:hypothetical protein